MNFTHNCIYFGHFDAFVEGRKFTVHVTALFSSPLTADQKTDPAASLTEHEIWLVKPTNFPKKPHMTKDTFCYQYDISWSELLLSPVEFDFGPKKDFPFKASVVYHRIDTLKKVPTQQQTAGKIILFRISL
jgi:hypothetical protein